MTFKELMGLRFLRVDEPGAEGGGGGGGEPSPPADEQKPVSAREKIMEKFESPESTPQPEAPPKKEEAPPAKPDSEPPKPPEEPLEKRFKDTQTAFHKSQEQLRVVGEARESLQKKIDLVSKYVDWDKLTEHEKTAELEKANQPVTHAELAEMERQKSEKEERERTDKAVSEATEAEQKFLVSFRTKHPHVVPYIESGAARGVALAIATADPNLNLEEIGEKVATHFKTLEEGIRKRVADELNTRKESLDGAGPPKSSGTMPDEGGGDRPADYTTGGEISERKARLTRQRTLI